MVSVSLKTYKSLGLKHSSWYLAELSFRFNNRFHMDSAIDVVLKHATQINHLPHHELKLAGD